MKANELRIGNWVRSKGENRVVESIYDQGINLEITPELYGDWKCEYDGYFELNWYENALIEPIELTEEWLTRFGITKLKVSGYVTVGATYWRKGNITFYEIDGKYFLPIGEHLGDQIGRTVIQFDKVHELQNIFALTGTELTLKQ